MANQYVNKVIVDGVVKLDISNDDVKASNLLTGIKAHDKTGAPIVGTCDYDANTSDATAAAAEILKDKTAYVGGSKVTGSMPNNGSKTLEITEKDGTPAIPMGFHDGSGKAKISDTEKAKLIPANIRDGITILGVEGTMSGSEDMQAQAKSVTPSFSVQEILPDENYNCLSSVTVAAIPVTETDNEAGGKTLTIGG